MPAHAAAHASAHAAGQAAAIAYADVTLKLRFHPSSSSCAGFRCQSLLFVCLNVCRSVRPSVYLHPTDSLSVRQTVSPFFGPSVRQSVSLSVRTPFHPSTVRPSTVSLSVNRRLSVNRCPSVNRRPSVNRFYWGEKKKKNHTRNPNWESAHFDKIERKLYISCQAQKGCKQFKIKI